MNATAVISKIIKMQGMLQMISSLNLQSCLYPEQAVVKDGDCFDFIIIGGGSAGCVLANRLSEYEFANVLLIEAGDDPPIESMLPGFYTYTSRTRIDKNYTSINDNWTQQCHRNNVANLTSGNVLGGGSSVNYLLYARGSPHDYDAWATITNDSNWSWESVFPYFIKSERLADSEVLNSSFKKYHGTNGFIGVTREPRNETHKYFEAFKELGEDILLDVNGEQQNGYTQQMFTIADGVRQSTAYTYLSSAKCRSNLYVLKNTLVTKIVLDSKNCAVGVIAKTVNNKKMFIKARKEVVLSAGALNSPKILMSSGIGIREYLEEMKIKVRSDLPVGQNYFDHVSIFMCFKMEKSNAPQVDPDLHKFGLNVFTGYVALDKSQPYPDYQTLNVIVPNDSPSIGNLCSFNYWYDYEFCQRLYEAGKGRNTLFVVLTLMHPKSRGRVFLEGIDPSLPPNVITGMLHKKEDLENMVNYVEHFIRVLNTSYFKSVNSEFVDLAGYKCDGFEFGTKEYWRCYIYCAMSTYYHYAGTCAMGSVVDSHLQVFGVKRLRVVDASVMPTPVGANTNAPVIMIAEKAADFIKQMHYNEC